MEICFRYPEYMKKDKPYGCLFMHVLQMLELWEELKRRYLPTLVRISRNVTKSTLFSIPMVDDIVKVMIILHDYGKASKNYVSPGEYNAQFYHEIVSGCLSYNVLKNCNERIASTIASAILLHHEHRIYRKMFNIGGYSYARKSAIRYIVRKCSSKVFFDSMANEAFKTIIQSFTSTGNTTTDLSAFKEQYCESELAESMREIRDNVWCLRYKSWFTVGAFNHILVLLDIRAACKTREEKDKLSYYFDTVLHKGRLPLQG